MLTRPVWAEIQLANLAHNMGEVRRLTRPTAKVCAVIKADGYGHGAVAIGQTLLDAGADYFAVATLSEAIQLRSTFLNTPILVLGYTPEDMADQVISHGLIQTLWDFQQAQGFERAAQQAGTKVRVHLKIDTGMSRVGFQVNAEGKRLAADSAKLPSLFVEGIYTHFACADEVDKTTTHRQVVKFNEMVSALEAEGIQIPIKHVSNSAAIIDLPEYNFDMVRAGIMLYGLYPSKDVKLENVELREVMSLKAQLSRVATIPAGEGISYGHIYKTERDTLVGTVPLGYADGYTRLLTKKSHLLYSGRPVPVVGKICMDQFMVSLPGEMSPKRGDQVVLFGESEGTFLSIDQVAQWLGTINYEIVCMIGKRVPRRYLFNETQVNYNDYLL